MKIVDLKRETNRARYLFKTCRKKNKRTSWKDV